MVEVHALNVGRKEVRLNNAQCGDVATRGWESGEAVARVNEKRNATGLGSQWLGNGGTFRDARRLSLHHSSLFADPP